MTIAKMLIITISTKGCIGLPNDICQRRKWVAGTRLLIEETPEGILLKPARAFAETLPDDVFGTLSRKRRPAALEKMDAGVLAEAKRRHPRD